VWQVLLDQRVIMAQQVQQEPLELKEALAHQERGVWQVLLDRTVFLAREVPLVLKEVLAHQE
jgi:hypothetical protein